MKTKATAWKWNGKYPVRCQVIDPTGHVVKQTKFKVDLVAKCPTEAKPHVGKTGRATLLKNGDVKIKLDDGQVLYGYECWWVALPPE
jgi:DNA polymerase III sliding clamp (beta) subunit (PCNA family)